MTNPNNVAPTTFLGFRTAKLESLSYADVVIFGAPDATPHMHGRASHSAGAPAALRESTGKIAEDPLRWDFDQDGPLVPEGLRVIDLGDLPTDPARPEENRSLIASTTVSILKAGAIPLLLGGDRFPFSLVLRASGR